MKFRLLLPLALVAVPVSVPAAAACVAGQGAGRDNQTVCRWQDAVGSRLGRRTCLTRAQWRERDRDAQTSRDRVLERAKRQQQGGDMFAPREAGPN